MKIRFCKHTKGAKEACTHLQQEHPDLNIKLKDCLKQCKACREQPVVLVDKKRITAETWDELLGNLGETV